MLEFVRYGVINSFVDSPQVLDRSFGIPNLLLLFLQVKSLVQKGYVRRCLRLAAATHVCASVGQRGV